MRHERAVIPGFFGADIRGDVKTFTRGGSDITGAIVSRGVQADIYENWTDVSGLLMTDPSIVREPKAIDTVTYRELRELAYMGAKVLHDRVALVHVHGHASQEELKMMLSLVRPKYLVPVHGEYRHLMAHAKLAWDVVNDCPVSCWTHIL